MILKDFQMQTIKIRIIISFLVTALLLSLTYTAMAEEGRIHFGKLKIIPEIKVEAIHADNIYLENGTSDPNETEVSDWITHIRPALTLEFPFPARGGVRLGYMGDLAYYSDNDINDWMSHTGFFNLNYDAPGGLIIGIDETYTDTEDPYDSLNEYMLGLAQIKRWYNILKTKAGYNFRNRFKIMGYYNFYKQDYDLEEDYTQDYYSNEFGGGVRLRVLPKTWTFVRYHHGARDYFTHPAGTGVTESNDSGYQWQRVNAGLTWDSGAKLDGELNFGYQWNEYDNEFDVNGDGYNDNDSWIANTFMSYRATSTTMFTLSMVRAHRETGSTTNEYYEDTGAGLKLKQAIFQKFTLRLSGIISKNEYNLPANRPREDDNYKAIIGIDYLIQEWLSVGAGYKYWKKDSNQVENDFTDNQFIVSMRIVY